MRPPEEYPGELGQRIKDLEAEIAIVFGQLRKQFPVAKVCINFGMAAVMLVTVLYVLGVNILAALLAAAVFFAGSIALFHYGWQRIGFHYFLDSLKNAGGIAARQYDTRPMENPLFEKMHRLDMHRDELIYQVTRVRPRSKSYVGTILLAWLVGMIGFIFLTVYLSQ